MVQLSYSYMTPRKTIALNIQTFDGKVMFLLQITADSDYSHEIKRCLLLERKVMTNLDSVLKSGDIALPTKVWMDSQNCGFFSSHV